MEVTGPRHPASVPRPKMAPPSGPWSETTAKILLPGFNLAICSAIVGSAADMKAASMVTRPTKTPVAARSMT
jgi:hypothetical protein